MCLGSKGKPQQWRFSVLSGRLLIRYSCCFRNVQWQISALQRRYVTSPFPHSAGACGGGGWPDPVLERRAGHGRARGVACHRRPLPAPIRHRAARGALPFVHLIILTRTETKRQRFTYLPCHCPRPTHEALAAFHITNRHVWRCQIVETTSTVSFPAARAAMPQPGAVVVSKVISGTH